ncbi:MAG TPA: alpha-glucan family phosphorylase, partial [Solirubrobacteraceae bacterium]|nr:alpha-glucan family phosphorylase [Solirubrobacteraceae bacterium]
MDHATTQYDGQIDILAAAEDLAERIPDALAPLARIAYNYRWAWLPGGPELFRAVDSERFDLCMRNPVRLLQESPARVLKRAADDRDLVARAQALEAEIAADIERPPGAPGVDPAHPVGFLCAEYGVHVSLPVYSGGLGALAGDLLKEASDQAVPLVAVGLMYRKGYFRQRIDASGWQHEYWVDTDPDRLPAALVTGRDGAPITVTVPIGDSDVVARIWRVDIGRIPLFLLDTDCGDNGPMERWITGRLYDGDPQTRLAQYSLLGVGGVRALRALGYEPGVLHLNEGHAALAPLELARGYREAEGLSQSEALDRARSRTVFTTHTPVPAGNDSYPAGEIEEAVSRLAGELGFSTEELLTL